MQVQRQATIASIILALIAVLVAVFDGRINWVAVVLLCMAAGIYAVGLVAMCNANGIRKVIEDAKSNRP